MPSQPSTHIFPSHHHFASAILDEVYTPVSLWEAVVHHRSAHRASELQHSVPVHLVHGLRAWEVCHDLENVMFRLCFLWLKKMDVGIFDCKVFGLLTFWMQWWQECISLDGREIFLNWVSLLALDYRHGALVSVRVCCTNTSEFACLYSNVFESWGIQVWKRAVDGAHTRYSNAST